MLFSELKDKKVFSMRDAAYVGKVTGLYLDRETYAPSHLVLSDARGHILPYAAVFGAGDMLMIRDDSALTDASASLKPIYFDIGLPVIDVTGALLGMSADLELDAKRAALTFSYGAGDAARKKIVSSSAEAIIVNINNKSFEPKVRKKKEAPAPTVTFEYMQPAAPAVSPANADARIDLLPQSAPQYRPAAEAERIVSDYSFLLGRYVQAEITDLTRTFVIPQGTYITNKVIEDAKRAGKLVDLTLHSAKAQ